MTRSRRLTRSPDIKPTRLESSGSVGAASRALRKCGGRRGWEEGVELAGEEGVELAVVDSVSRWDAVESDGSLEVSDEGGVPNATLRIRRAVATGE